MKILRFGHSHIEIALSSGGKTKFSTKWSSARCRLNRTVEKIEKSKNRKVQNRKAQKSKCPKIEKSKKFLPQKCFCFEANMHFGFTQRTVSNEKK